MSDTNHTTSLQNPTNEDEFDIVELVKNLTILSGVDWDKLSEEKQTKVFEVTVQNISNHLNSIIENLPDPSLKKHLDMIIQSKFNPKLIAQYPEVSQWLSLIMQSLISSFINPKESL